MLIFYQNVILIIWYDQIKKIVFNANKEICFNIITHIIKANIIMHD